jgi:hypothetical protein
MGLVIAEENLGTDRVHPIDKQHNILKWHAIGKPRKSQSFS